MALTHIDVCNQALVIIGAEPISSFTDGVTESIILANIYESTKEAELSAHTWRFATKQFELTAAAGTPVGRWSIGYRLPNDLIRLIAVTLNGQRIEYDRYGDYIYTNLTENDFPVVDYIFRASEADWLPYFRQAFVWKLAALMASALERQAARIEQLIDMYDREIRKARAIDSQSQTSKSVSTGRLIGVR